MSSTGADGTLERAIPWLRRIGWWSGREGTAMGRNDRTRNAVATGVLVVTLAGALLVSTRPDRLHRQAEDALKRYAAAVRASSGAAFVPVGQLTGQLGDWEPAVGENGKQALLAGRLVAAGELPPAPPGRHPVTWPDGTALDLPLLSAKEALDQVASTAEPANCSGCTPLRVTGADLVEQPVETSRGTAQAPVWVFTLAGTQVRASRLAVQPRSAVTVTPPPWDPFDAPGGLAIESARLAPDGVTLTVDFTGAPGPRSQPCGADYSAEPVESDTAVVVIVHEHGHGGEESCSAVGASRTAVARLARPLGDRAVLEVVQGTPVPVTR